jgi:hypothetical protein
MKRHLQLVAFATVSLLIIYSNLYGKTKKQVVSSVAIVVDTITYNKIHSEVDKYIESVENPSRKCIILLDKWGSPDSIRAELFKLYKTMHLEGALLIGDIPIPMIRDAQHLTTAFKMNQNRDWKESSVPSDRFYDDFDLDFKFLKQDSDNKLFFYYSLAPQSPQYISCDIYSARIKAPEGDNKYKLIADYLNKATDAHKQERQMKKILHFGGHGYNSESINARIDEAIALTEHFPFLNNETGNLAYIDFSFDKFVKYRLLSAISDNELDLAILHHHGSEDTQYLNGSPFAAEPGGWINLSRNYFRSKMRSSRDTLETKKYFIDKYDIPQSWLEDAFDKDKIEADSLYSAQMDIHITDLNNFKPGSKIVILDACYNGAFNYDDYMAAHYLFNNGKTLVVKANTVNTLQDTWTTELIGLLNWGVSAGNWAKGQLTLESHLFGDPTFSFAPQTEMASQLNINEKIIFEKNNTKFWRKILNLSNNDRDVCDLKSLAIKMLYKNKAITSEELLDIQENSSSRILRLESFNTNRQISDSNFYKAILLGMNDSYELTQRLSVLFSGNNYNPLLIPNVSKLYLSPTTSARVAFQLSMSMEGYNSEKLIQELERQNREIPFWQGEEKLKRKIKSISNTKKSMDNDISEIMNGSMNEKNQKFFISAQRNKCMPQAVDPIIKLLNDSKNDAIRIMAVEALGWYKYSFIKEQIIDKCKALLKKEDNPIIKDELIKTINRLN